MNNTSAESPGGMADVVVFSLQTDESSSSTGGWKGRVNRHSFVIKLENTFSLLFSPSNNKMAVSSRGGGVAL